MISKGRIVGETTSFPKAYAERYASALDEGGLAEDAADCIARRLSADDEDPEGGYALVDSLGGGRWDRRRFASREAAQSASDDWHRWKAYVSPGVTLRWHLMSRPVAAEFRDGQWVAIDDDG